MSRKPGEHVITFERAMILVSSAVTRDSTGGQPIPWSTEETVGVSEWFLDLNTRSKRSLERERPPIGEEPRCKCGHLVSQHFQHDPGLCNECSECKGFERETPVGNDDPYDQGSGANARQVGGEHYGLSNFQHWDLVALFDLDYFQGQITKYVMRWSKKNGVVDLEKAQHFLEKYIELIKNKKIKANA